MPEAGRKHKIQGMRNEKCSNMHHCSRHERQNHSKTLKLLGALKLKRKRKRNPIFQFMC
jgi:hypothetical protein